MKCRHHKTINRGARRWESKNNPLFVVNKHFWLEWARTNTTPLAAYNDSVSMPTTTYNARCVHGKQAHTVACHTHLHQPHKAVETRWLNDSFCTVIPIIATTKTTPSHRTNLSNVGMLVTVVLQNNYAICVYILIYIYIYFNIVLFIYAYGNLIIRGEKAKMPSLHNFYSYPKTLQPLNAMLFSWVQCWCSCDALGCRMNIRNVSIIM